MTELQTAHWLGLDSSHLSPIDDHHGLMQPTKQAWLAMVEAAANDGLTLNLVSSYRSFGRQQVIWDNKFNGHRPVLDDHNVPVAMAQLTELEKILAIMRFSALPGTSRHHWGTDLDVYSKPLQQQPLQLVASEYQSGGPQFQTHQWLQQRAHEFDFFFPYSDDLGGVACEPWHLSHRPMAEKVESMRQPEAILDAIVNANVAGQKTIAANFDTLFARFVSPISRLR
ncbi:carboxypeptidase [Neiella marina]|uniref:Carboxypeptidase n=1 Tax=Neiella marina TaxID=508461 RepID=A0A8J2U6N9_9GAMM|nr:M15 family metallopeptidase [Neiella marina]GGA82239.1 carboxypeptidase [Neiella marina]